MVYIVYYSEINLQIYNYAQKDVSRISKYVPDERIKGIFASAGSLPSSATLWTQLFFSLFCSGLKSEFWG